LVSIFCGAGLGAYNKYLVTPIYTSQAKVYVLTKQDDSKMTTYSDIQTGTQLTKDYMILVKSRPVTEEVIRKLNLNMTHDQLVGMINVNTPKDTRILEIMINNPDAAVAKELADTLAEVSAERMVNVMDIKKVNVVEPGNLPTAPSSPNVLKKAIIGGIFGAVLTCVIILFIYIVNDSIRTTDDINKYLGINTLGVIPIVEETGKKKKEKKHKKKESSPDTALAV
jgi:capsular polysaccharide biosynthesis protein